MQVTGRLAIIGAAAMDWFVMRFAGVMDAYTWPVVLCKKQNNPFDAETLRLFRAAKEEMLRSRMMILFVSLM